MRATNSSYGDYDNLVLNGNYDEMVSKKLHSYILKYTLIFIFILIFS